MPKILALRPKSQPHTNAESADSNLSGTATQEFQHDIAFADDEILSDQKVLECFGEMHQLSLDAIGSLSKIVNIDQYSWPGLRDLDYWYKNLYALIRDALGLGFEESLDDGFRRLKVDLRDIAMYIRMIVIAEVTDQVFVSAFPRVPIISRAWAKRAFRSLAKGAPTDQDIAQQALLAWRNDSATKKQTSLNAKLFAENMIETLSPLLSDHKSDDLSGASERVRQRALLNHSGNYLEGIYLVAMALRNEMNLKRCTYEFFWPEVGEEFDRKEMDMEVMSRRKESTAANSPKGAIVIATLLPGVRRLGQDNDQRIRTSETGPSASLEKKVIARALVYLGTSEKRPR